MFSGTVKLLDLNDYIKPGEECVVLTKTSNLDASTKAYLNIDGEDLKPDLIKPTTTDKAKININDCLACNGCITSSEAILVEEQSVTKFIEQHPQFTKKFVLLTPQSRVSLAYFTKLTEIEIHNRLNEYFSSLGFEFVDDFTIHIDVIKEMEYSNMLGGAVKPQMCSECPGWVCYLEKVLGDKFIPFASTVKTPQLFAAELYKQMISSYYGVKYQEVYCMLIAPCFDKKLEAAREEAKIGKAVINLVLSTEELYRYILEKDGHFFDPGFTVSIENVFSSLKFAQTLVSIGQTDTSSLYKNSFVPLSEFRIYKSFNKMGSSNGYVDYVLKRLDMDFGLVKSEENIRKNKNFLEISVQTKTGQKFNLALVYGFKNIQNLVRQVKTKKCSYDYVEIMACPSGCINGGGQIKTDDPLTKNKVIEEIYSLYESKDALDALELVRALVDRLNQNKIMNGFDNSFMFYKFEAIVNSNVQTISW